MGTLWDEGGRGGSIVEALNANIYGNGTQTLVTDQTIWHYLIPYLACYFKILVFDLAFSPNLNPHVYDPTKYATLSGYAQNLQALLHHLDFSNTIYIGHSMSAMIGCLAATKNPQLFQHLILPGGSPRYLNAKGYEGGFQRSELDTIFESMKQNFSSWAHSFASIAVGVNDPNGIAEFERSLGRMKPEVAPSVAKTVFLSDLRWVLPRVLVPCTIIQSRKDKFVPNSVAFYMKRKLGCHSMLQTLKSEGHLPQITAHSLLLNFLKKSLSIE